ncbi:MAG: DUF2934 domain-containing protein [Bryobacteraceae bacterium]
MPRRPKEAGPYLAAGSGGAAPAPVKRKRALRAKAAVAASGGQPRACAPNGAEPPAEFSVSEQEDIARLAYSYWEARGGEGGSSEEDWFRAEQEFRAKREDSTR